MLNPIAGMGGSLALKGTDGDTILAQARSLGAVPLRALRGLSRLEGTLLGVDAVRDGQLVGRDLSRRTAILLSRRSRRRCRNAPQLCLSTIRMISGIYNRETTVDTDRPRCGRTLLL